MATACYVIGVPDTRGELVHRLLASETARDATANLGSGASSLDFGRRRSDSQHPYSCGHPEVAPRLCACITLLSVTSLCKAGSRSLR